MAFSITMKPFKTYEQQIELLRERNLLPRKQSNNPIDFPCSFSISRQDGLPVTSSDIDKCRQYMLSDSDPYVKEILQMYGYYNIVNQYNKPFLNADGTYKSGIDFFELYSLQQIDLCIKNAIFYPLLQIEQHLKICIAYEYASTYGPFDGENMSNYVEPYFKKENYNIYLKTFDKRPKYELLIDHLKKIYADDGYKPFAHYKKNHHHIPIWVLINRFTFGELVHFYEVLKIQNKIASEFHLDPSQLRTSMLFLSHVRNDCAHFAGFSNQNYPKLKDNIKLLSDFKSEFGFRYQQDVPNIYLVLILFRYFLPMRDYKNAIFTVSDTVFKQVLNNYIPHISDYMKNELATKDTIDYKKKISFLLTHPI